MESYFYETTHTGAYSNFFVAGVYKGITENLLSHALRNIILEYPSFTYNVFGGDLKSLVLRQVLKIDFEDVVEFISKPMEPGSKLDDQISQQVVDRGFRFGIESPLWRVIVLNNETVIFYCDHILFDGVSLANFHHLLLENMNQVKSSEEKLDRLFDFKLDSFGVSYSPNHCDIYNAKWHTVIWALYHELVPRSIKFYVQKCKRLFDPNEPKLTGYSFKGNHVLRLKDFRVNSIYVNVPPEKLSFMLKECRYQRVLMTALISYISLAAIKQVTKNADLAVGFPVSMRDKIKLRYPQDTTFGIFVKGEYFDLTAIEFDSYINWDDVRMIHRRITSLLETGRANDQVGMLKFINVCDWQLSQVGTHLRDTVQISNLGLQKVAHKKGVVEIVDMFFNQCIGFAGGYLNPNIISTDVNGMNIAMAYHPNDAQEIEPCLPIFESMLHNFEAYI